MSYTYRIDSNAYAMILTADGVMSWILKFADDTKICRNIVNGIDNIQLQQDLDKLVDWSFECLMLFNEKKCKITHVGINVYSIENHIIEYRSYVGLWSSYFKETNSKLNGSSMIVSIECFQN